MLWCVTSCPLYPPCPFHLCLPPSCCTSGGCGPLITTIPETWLFSSFYVQDWWSTYHHHYHYYSRHPNQSPPFIKGSHGCLLTCIQELSPLRRYVVVVLVVVVMLLCLFVCRKYHCYVV
jgi:hypothetical protein